MDRESHPMKIARCALTGEEYLRLDPARSTREEIARLSIEELRDVLILALKESGHNVYPSDTPSGFDTEGDEFFLLESQRAEPRVWSVQAWSLFGCYRKNRPIDEEEVKRFYELVLSEEAQEGSLLTTGTFTEGARTAAEERRIELIDGDNLYGLLLNASSEGPYSPACRALPEGLREELILFKTRVQSLGELGNQMTGKWTPPLQMEKLIKTLVDRTVTLFGSTPEKEAPAFEKRLRDQIRELRDDISKLEGDLNRLDSMLGIRSDQ